MYTCMSLCDCLKRSMIVAYQQTSANEFVFLPVERHLYKTFAKLISCSSRNSKKIATMTMPMPCTYEFSKGFGTGVAEALGNWGFSNRTCSAGRELQRLKCLFAKMDSLRSNKPKMCVKYDRRYDPDAWYVKPSLDECKPAWTFPSKRPLITYCSTAIILKVSDKRVIGSALTHVIPGHSYVQQGTSKWYRRGSDCCYQPSCLAPQCPVRYCKG